jgi:hypothetical protein
LEKSRQNTDSFASAELDKWFDELKARVDPAFLDWYFGYWQTQVIGIQALLNELLHKADNRFPPAAEKMTEKLQEQFATMVIQPNTAQMRLERIIKNTATKYVTDLSTSLELVRLEYKISPADWERYISDISSDTGHVEANRQVPLSMKTIYAAGTAGVAVIALKLAKVVSGKVLAGIGTKTVAKAGQTVLGKIVAKTAGKTAAKAGGKFLGAYIGIAIIAWDLYDHQKTVEENRPILKQNIFDYFNELKLSLLYDPEHGIMSTINEIDKELIQGLDAARTRR